MIDVLADGHGNMIIIIDYSVIACAAVVAAFGSGWFLRAAYARRRLQS